MSNAQHASDSADVDRIMDPPLLVCLLGRVRLLHRGKPFRLTDKAVALLYVLARQGRTGVERDVILATLWPDKEPRLASRSLNTLVWSINQQLSPIVGPKHAISQTNGVYSLNRHAGIDVDVEQFDVLADAGDMHARLGNLATAADLYRRAAGLYMGDLNVANETDADVIIERERLRARLEKLLADVAHWSFERRDILGCLAAAQRVLSSDPYREDMHRLLMRCHLALGQRSQALRQYQVCRRLLNTEFNADPEPATTELFERLRTQPG